MLLCFFYLNKQKQPREMFCKKAIFKNFSKFTGEHQCWSFVSDKAAGLRPLVLLKKRLLHHRYHFSVNFTKLLTAIFLEHLWVPTSEQINLCSFQSVEKYYWCVQCVDIDIWLMPWLQTKTKNGKNIRWQIIRNYATKTYFLKDSTFCFIPLCFWKYLFILRTNIVNRRIFFREGTKAIIHITIEMFIYCKESGQILPSLPISPWD